MVIVLKYQLEFINITFIVFLIELSLSVPSLIAYHIIYKKYFVL